MHVRASARREGQNLNRSRNLNMSVEATESQRRRVPKRFVEIGAWVHSLWNRGEEVVREGVGHLNSF